MTPEADTNVAGLLHPVLDPRSSTQMSDSPGHLCGTF
jgi:hypothetical protein